MYPLTIVVGNPSRILAEFKKEIPALSIVTCDHKIDTIKNITDTIDNLSIPVLFYFPEADKMYKNVKSSLLKLTEESPRNVFFLLVCKNENSFPKTLKSRANILFEFSEKIFSPQTEDLADKVVKLILEKAEPRKIMSFSSNLKFYKKDEENPDKVELFAFLQCLRIKLVDELKKTEESFLTKTIDLVEQKTKLCRFSNFNKLCIFDSLALDLEKLYG